MRGISHGGKANLHLEPFSYVGWSRGTCRVEMASPKQRPLQALSLVHAPSTPPGGIEAEVVDIRKDEPRNLGSRLERLFNRWEEGDLRTTDIEGAESVYLENVTCDNVTGGRVTIGEGCRIRGSVTYMESIEVHPDARLENPPQQAQPEG